MEACQTCISLLLTPLSIVLKTNKEKQTKEQKQTKKTKRKNKQKENKENKQIMMGAFG